MKLSMNKNVLKKLQGWREMPVVRALVAVPEDLEFIPSIHMMGSDHL